LERLKPTLYVFQPLFYAIRNSCSLDVIETLFDAQPDAILERDFCGELPFYLLFRPKTDPRVLELVLNRNPSLALLEEKNFSGSQSLLQRLCAYWVELRTRASFSSMAFLPARNNNNNDNNVNNSSQYRDNLLTRSKVRSEPKLLDRWNKLVLTARAAHRITHTPPNRDVATMDIDPSGSHDTHLPELHVALRLKCLPPAVLCQFVEMYPEQVSMPMIDATIQTNRQRIPFAPATKPLSACTASDRMEIGGTDSTCGEDDANTTTCASPDEMRNVLPLHYFLSEYSLQTTAAKRHPAIDDRGNILKGLIRAFPRAASIEHTPSRNLSLQMAIHSDVNWDKGLQELVYANPSALGTRDELGTNLVPFLQQATKRSDPDHGARDFRKIVVYAADDGCDAFALSTTYCLLREDPSVLSRMLVAPSLQ
jgi:hypothetical protein